MLLEFYSPYIIFNSCFCFNDWFLHSIFLFLLYVSGIILAGMKRLHALMKENNCSVLICFLFWLVGLQLKEMCVILDHKNTLWNLNKMPFIRKILLLFRKYFFQPNRAGLLSREWLAVCDLFTGWLAHDLELKVKRTALLGVLPTLLGPNSTNSACSREKESTLRPHQPFYKCHFWLCSINKSRRKNTTKQTYLLNYWILLLRS